MSDEPAEPDLVTLFYRADRTRLSLSVRVSGMVDFGVLASQSQSANPLGRHGPVTLNPAHLGVGRLPERPPRPLSAGHRLTHADIGI
jgi:hypothetical protein